MRIVVLPGGIMPDLKRAAPGLAEALAKPLLYNEDPELRVEREEHSDGPSTWSLVVESESVYEKVQLDPNSDLAMRVAIGIYLLGIIEGIKHDLPWIREDMDLEGMVLNILSAGRSKAS